MSDDVTARRQVDVETVEVGLHRPEAVFNLSSYPRCLVQVLCWIAEARRLDIVSGVFLRLRERLLVYAEDLFLCCFAFRGGMVAVQESLQFLRDRIELPASSAALLLRSSSSFF